MTRVKRTIQRIIKKEFILKKAKGYKGGNSSLFKATKQTLLKAEKNAYRDRRYKQRLWNKIWITRINGLLRSYNINWSLIKFFLKNNKIKLNRHILSQISIYDPTLIKIYILFYINTLCRI